MGLPVAFAGGVINSISGVFATDKNPERYAKNAAAFNAAKAGDTNALDFLKYRSNRFGLSPGPIPGWTSEPISGWGSQETRDDAYNKYQQITAGAAPLPPKGSALDVVLDPIREGAAEAIQRAAAGIGTLGARAIAPEDSPGAGAINIPTDVKTLRNIALGAAAVVLVVVVVVARR